MKKTRGERNKNLGNVRKNPNFAWTGEVGQDKYGFVIFSDVRYGLRAIYKILSAYEARGIFDVDKIVATYAPASDNNNVNAYANFLRARVGDSTGKIRTAKIISGIVKFENGKELITDSEVKLMIDKGDFS